jgi:sugar lactone lactonase YvrE
LGHLNSAYPDDNGGSYLTTLGQGHVAHVDRAGTYTLLASGYIGAHGVRRSSDGTFVYFTESPAGRVNKIFPDGRVETLVQLETNWLHDAQELAPDTYACLPVDRNELLLVDTKQNRELARFDMSSRGLNPQFISVVRGPTHS